MADNRALVIGEALIDIVVRGSNSSEFPGGSPMNVAVALARLGREVELATWIGNDPHARAIAAHVAESGVLLTPGRAGAARTPTATARLDASGAARYEFDLEWDFKTPPELAGVAVVHTGSLATAVSPGAEQVVEFFTSLKGSPAAAPTLSFDPNLRPALIADPAAIRPVVERLVAAADLVKASDEDLAWLYPDRDGAAVAREWAETGPAVVVLTRGAAGALALAGPILLDTAAPRTHVADTVGAGDTFMAGLIDGLWVEGLVGAERRAALRSIGENQLLRAIDRAASAAAVTVSRPGADPPWADELV
ncbi:MAG: PfkB family carbohydrate kinase [Bifidobacteriaceae bacterium]|jgi:fructokinase|nr:PfkB family carbohydrate kinase [Bifidobacteriaceae bacterium]